MKLTPLRRTFLRHALADDNRLYKFPHIQGEQTGYWKAGPTSITLSNGQAMLDVGMIEKAADGYSVTDLGRRALVGGMKIKNAPLACCRAEIEKNGLIPPSDDALAAILEPDRAFVQRMNRMYTTVEGGLDTWERELLLDLLAEHFIPGSQWPRMLDDDVKVGEFITAMVVASADAGWK